MNVSFAHAVADASVSAVAPTISKTAKFATGPCVIIVVDVTYELTRVGRCHVKMTDLYYFIKNKIYNYVCACIII